MAIVPLQGWALDRIVQFDEACPGFAGTYLRASPERRQVIAAFMSVARVGSDKEREAAAMLASADHRTILGHAFPAVPSGLRRALAKSGAQPHDPTYYRDLHNALFSGRRHVQAAIMQSPKLTPDRLAIITALPADLCDARIVCRIEARADAHDLSLVTGLLAERGIDRAEFVHALRRSTAPLKKVVQRWALQLAFPPHPIPPTEEYQPIRDGAELRKVALAYQNCSRRYINASITGENAFGEFIDSDGRKALICLQMHEGIWTLDGVYVRRNRQVATDLDKRARAFAAQHGILERNYNTRVDDPISALKRLTRSVFDW